MKELLAGNGLKVALFALVNTLLGAWLVIIIGNIAVFGDHVTYSATFEDVTGLLVNDAVKVAGVPVGKVTAIGVERGQAVVEFEVDADRELGLETTVGVRVRNLLGLRYLYVYPAGEGAVDPGHEFGPDATRPPADFGLVLQRFTPVVRALEPEAQNRITGALLEALQGREDEVRSLIARAANLAETVATRDTTIATLLQDAEALTAAYAARRDELGTLLDSFADVSVALAARNDQIEQVVTQLDDGMAELRRFLEANDGDLRGTIDALEHITDVLAVNHENLEDVVTYLGRGLVSYHRISRWGQWFNIRVVGVSTDGEQLAAERGGSIPPAGERSPTTSSGFASWFQVPATTGAR